MALHGISIKPSHKGKFARAVGKKPGEPITSADIKKGESSSSATERKEANFAKVARTWKHGERKASRGSRMYAKGTNTKSFAAKRSKK